MPFAPRLGNLKDRKFHLFEKADVYPALADHIGLPINTAWPHRAVPVHDRVVFQSGAGPAVSGRSQQGRGGPLKHAVFFHERGEICDRSLESQAFRASGLNLVVTAIVHWNTIYLSRATAHLRRTGRQIPDALLKHVSPLSWEHINLTGIYSWDADQQMPEGFRALRLPGSILCAA